MAKKTLDENNITGCLKHLPSEEPAKIMWTQAEFKTISILDSGKSLSNKILFTGNYFFIIGFMHCVRI